MNKRKAIQKIKLYLSDPTPVSVIVNGIKVCQSFPLVYMDIEISLN